LLNGAKVSSFIFALEAFLRKTTQLPACKYDSNMQKRHCVVAFAKCQTVSWAEISPWRGLYPHANLAALASQQQRMNYSPLFTHSRATSSLSPSAAAANALYWLHLPLSEKSLSVCPGGQVNYICKHTIYVFLGSITHIYLRTYTYTQKRGAGCLLFSSAAAYARPYAERGVLRCIMQNAAPRVINYELPSSNLPFRTKHDVLKLSTTHIIPSTEGAPPHIHGACKMNARMGAKRRCTI
jgi:hypothetical protein